MAVKFDHNQDGSVIVKLSYPVTVNGEQTERATIPALRGKHLRVCPFNAGTADIPVGKLVEFAALIVMPVGVVDELDPVDAIAVGAEVAAQVGKSRRTGGDA